MVNRSNAGASKAASPPLDPPLDLASVLLVRAAAHEDIEVASNSWRQWLEQFGTPVDGQAAGGHESHPALRLLPTVASRMRHLLTPDVVAIANTARKNTLFVNLPTIAALRDPLGALADAGIRPLILKGGALLSDAVFGDIGARWISDIDLLVTPEEAPTALRTLVRSGLERWPKEVPEHIIWKVMHAVSVTGPSINLDVHWTLLHHTRVTSEDLALRRRSQEAWLNSMKIIVPDHTDLLFHALAHGELPDLRWVVDAGILLNGRTDIDRLAAIAAERRYLTRVMTNVELLRAVLPTPHAEQLATALAYRRRRLGDTAHHNYGLGSRTERTSAAVGFAFNQIRDRPREAGSFLQVLPLHLSHSTSTRGLLRATRRFAPR